MQILHIVENYSSSSGGVRTVVRNLHHNLMNAGHESFILSCSKNEEDNIFLVKAKNGWLYSKNWIFQLQLICKKEKINCIHIHGTWMYPQLIAAKFAIKNRIPFVLSPHGMYEPWLWKKGRFKKTTYFNFLVKKTFSMASIIHSITKNEKENLKTLFPTNTVYEIPNLINQVSKEINQNFDEKYILFVGRLTEIKGIDLLIKAFINTQPNNFKLKIAGELNEYSAYLKSIIYESNIDSSKIEFLGFICGDLKNKLISNAYALICPSYSEVIGMVNLEAAILKTPVITTIATGLDKEWNSNGGVLINLNIENLEKSIQKVGKWSIAERIEAGTKLQNFVIKNYTWEEKINDWIQLYDIAINGKNN